MTIASAAAARTSVVDLDNVVAELRRSCRRRAAAEELVDELGLTGVVAGAGPVLWVGSWAAPARLRDIAASSPQLCEVYVDDRRPDLVDVLSTAGWTVDGTHDHVVHDGPVPEPALAPAGYTLRETADPSVVPAVRELIIKAFDAPRHIIEAGYPDDFFDKAAPARLLVAESNGKLVGCIGRRRQFDAAMLFALAVEPAHRHGRLGAALVAAATTAARLEGATFVHSTVTAEGRSVARKCGFRPVVTWIRLVRGTDYLVG